MTSAEISIDRTSLGLGPLVIAGDGSAPYSLTVRGLGRPVVTVRYTFADESPHLESSLLTQAVKEQTALPLEVLVQADSAAALEAAIAELDAAVWQFSYETTRTVDGVATTYQSKPTVSQVVDGVTLYAHVGEFFEVVSVVIPIDPTPLGA